jgi:hypothetical protein
VLLIPHLAALHAIGAWTTAAVLCAALVALLPDARRTRWRAALFLVAGTVVITLAATPLRAGASEQFPAVEYVLTRIRYLFGRPAPSLLSDWMRHLWSADHAPLAAPQRVQLFLPLLLCFIPWLANRDARAWRARFVITVAVFVLASIGALVDRSILGGAALVMIVLVSGAAVSFEWKHWTRAGAIALAAYTAVAAVVMEDGSGDIVGGVSRLTGDRDPTRFVWVSFENTDRELIRFISTRTSVSESILAPEDLSALLLAFTGRTSVQLAGTTSRVPSQRHVDLTRALYRDENGLYELCRRDQIDYVVYSIDVMLDGGPYSPASLAAISGLDPSSIAARMHFGPESLRHFTLMYENDHYRLFKVTDSPQPVFLTDHPLFFQPALFARDGNDLEHFREHVVYLMFAYANGMNARARGDAEEARRLFDQCIRQAAGFTKARLALASALMDLGRYEEARAQIAKVMEYAPDNPVALYSAAFVQVQLQDNEGAKLFLTLLAQTPDPAMQEKARELQYYIDNNIPLKPGGPQ